MVGFLAAPCKYQVEPTLQELGADSGAVWGEKSKVVSPGSRSHRGLVMSVIEADPRSNVSARLRCQWSKLSKSAGSRSVLIDVPRGLP
jgi:hypothetical protein